MKLNTLKTLGINLQIDDLFDEGGFSLANVNNTLLADQGQSLRAGQGGKCL